MQACAFIVQVILFLSRKQQQKVTKQKREHYLEPISRWHLFEPPLDYVYLPGNSFFFSVFTFVRFYSTFLLLI